MSVVVIGAGAAGLMAAIFAAARGASVRLLERTADGGRKILISGGGRCNVLPSRLAPERFVTDSPAHLMRGWLRSWPLHDQRDFFERDLRVPLALEEDTGKLFPVSNRARDVRDALVAEAGARGVSFEGGTTVADLRRAGTGWTVSTNRGDVAAARVVIATGGVSVPQTGSDGTGLRIAESFGVRLHPIYPALTPLVADPPIHAALSGVSLSVRIRVRSGGRVADTTGGFLFTHRGYSGPAVLDLSHVAARDQAAILRVQWCDLGREEWERRLFEAGGDVETSIAGVLPRRLAARLMDDAGIPADRRAADLRRTERLALLDLLVACELPWTGTEGFRKAEVTGGGVALDELDSRTLECRRHPGLFLCGEMLDAFGPIGGYNFAWAWATGRLAGLGAAA